jgi:YVTN family beta-propeller protein
MNLIGRALQKLAPVFLISILIPTLAGCCNVKDYLDKPAVTSLVRQPDLVFEKEMDIPTGKNPWGMALDAVNARLFVVSNHDNEVNVIDLTRKEMLFSIPTGLNPWQICHDDRRKRLYVTNGDEDSISVIDLELQREMFKVKVGRIPVGIAYGRNRDEIYVANSSDNNLTIIDAETLEIKEQVDTGIYPYSVGVDNINRLVFVSNMGEGTMSIIDPAKGQETRKISVGENPSGLSVDKDTGRVFLAGTQSNMILSLNPQKGIIDSTYSAPAFPIDTIAAPGQKYFYSVHRESGELAVYNTGKKSSVEIIKVGREPVSVIVNSLHNMIITSNFGDDTISLVRYRVMAPEPESEKGE